MVYLQFIFRFSVEGVLDFRVLDPLDLLTISSNAVEGFFMCVGIRRGYCGPGPHLVQTEVAPLTSLELCQVTPF